MLKAILVTLLVLTSTTATAEISPERQTELMYLLKHDCGSCHGMSLQGGLGPALKPEPLQRWTAEQLAMTILSGRPGTPMPPWKPFITPQEAMWLAQHLKRGITP